MNQFQKNITIGGILCTLIIVVGLVISLLPSSNRFRERKLEPFHPIDLKLPPASQMQPIHIQSQFTHEIDSYVIHIDDDTWIPLYTKEYREKKKKEMMKKQSGDASK